MRIRRPGRGRSPIASTTATAVDTGSATAAGRRADNQDRCAVERDLAVLSDGMGGHRGGALAATLSVRAAVAALEGRAHDPRGARLGDAFTAANAAVRVARADDPQVAAMGATLTVAVAIETAPGRSRWRVGHVGDSPAFVVTADGTTTLTEDHSCAAELVAAGVLTREEAVTHPGRHLLVRAVGPDPTIEADLTEVELRGGDALVLVSDGVSGSLAPTVLGALVRAAATAQLAAVALVGAAQAGGATDDVTAVVVRQVPSSTA